jgi:C-terminal processing protease CtpA/Prc
LPIAVEVVSHFVPRGKEIVSAKYTIFPDEIFDSKGYGDFENYPLVVLVD